MTAPTLHSVMISGGGTGGHIFPALAIGQALRAKYPSVDILYVGAKGKMEMQKVPEAGFPIVGLWISGLQRKLSWNNLSFPFKVISSLLKSRSLLAKAQPQVVIGVGGYASGPLLQAASSKGIPCLIQEQNSYAGLTNKLLAKKVQKICVAYEGMERYFPVDKIVYTGNPVRKEFLQALPDQAESRRALDLQTAKPTLLVLGGSLGARSINEAVKAQIDLLIGSQIQLVWQTGKLYEEEMQSFLKQSGGPFENIKAMAFIHDMAAAYAAADVIISRSGALSISELCLVAKPVILVPSPNVAEDHQTKNARALADKDAAILISDTAAKEQMIPKALELLIQDSQKAKLSTNIKAMAKPDATEAIVNEIIKLLK